MNITFSTTASPSHMKPSLVSCGILSRRDASRARGHMRPFGSISSLSSAQHASRVPPEASRIRSPSFFLEFFLSYIIINTMS